MGINSRIRRRSLRARAAAALASSLYFLQGTFEKIRLQRLFAQQAFQISDFFSQFSFAGVGRRTLPIFDGLHLVTPLVQLSAVNAQLGR
jgi:hypothetical protein